MMRWLTLFLALATSACVQGHFAQRGEPGDTFILDESRTKTPLALVVEGHKAFITYEETSCSKLKFTYLENHYEEKAFPTTIVSPIALGLAAAGLIFGLTSQDPGFFWPESVPAITPIGFVTAGVFGVAGFIPMAFGLGKPEYRLLRTVKSDEYDRVETNCSTSKRNKTEKLAWRAWLDDDKVVTGTTGDDGVFDIRKVALQTVLKGQKLTPFELEWLGENTEVFLKFELAGTARQLERIDLYEVGIYGPGARNTCSKKCIDAAEARQCRRRESLCIQEPGTDLDLCNNMRMSCLEKESPNTKAYEACFEQCVKKELAEVFNKK